jgi:iron complex outermembrane receptor protein
MKTSICLFAALCFAPNLYAHTDKKTEPRVHLSTVQVIGEEERTVLFDGVSPSLQLGGDELYRKGGLSIGESLRSEPGVRATDFGVSASRPVIRGFGGERIKILQNGIGLLDASGASDDHAVPVSALSADSLEIIRGPLNLMYGSSAIGGVVNISNSRIHSEFYNGFSGAIDAKVDSVKSYRRLGTKLDYGKNNQMWHVDGELSKSGLLDTPEGEVLNSQTEQSAIGLGFTQFTENKNSFGLSYSFYQNTYGVVAEEDVTIDQIQHRLDFAAEVKLGAGFFENLKIKSAQTLYSHDELEGPELGTEFENSGNETRFEFIQKKSDRLEGMMGLQFGLSEFSAQGEEAYLPVTDNRNAALFVFEKLKGERSNFTIGARLEHSEAEALGTKKDFLSSNLAVGMDYSLTDSVTLESNISYTERAPNFQELFANGGHVATGAFEIGDVDLEKEKALGFELAVSKRSKVFQGKVSAFYQKFDDYIKLDPTGAVQDGFPEFRYLATDDARIYGLEGELLLHLNPNFDLKLVGDQLRGVDRANGIELPRIAPARLSAELVHEWGSLRSNIRVEHVFAQNKTAVQETSTEDYTMVGLGTSYEILTGEQRYVLYAQVHNLFDEAGRNHISFLKNQMQLPGIGVALGLQGYF